MEYIEYEGITYSVLDRYSNGYILVFKESNVQATEGIIQYPAETYVIPDINRSTFYSKE